MPLNLYDTLTREMRELEPREPGKVSMYVCGPTVYDVPHLGHARTAITYDVLRRYLEWSGYEVTVVSNVTDIDDKIIARAATEGSTEAQVAETYLAEYRRQMDALGILSPTRQPKATEYVREMVDVIARLVARGAAYVVDGKGVYFSVAASSDYGQLAGRTLEQLQADAGARVDVDPDKRSPLDFALWKAAKPGEPTWPSPWGEGRPGWHTECVAMSMNELGAGFDIHGGGDDLVFPHHQNEQAQVSAQGQQFARHWVHSAMVNVGGKKMAKSEGNFTVLSDVLDAGYAQALRMAVLQTHYRRQLELDQQTLEAAAQAVRRVRSFATAARQMVGELVPMTGSAAWDATYVGCTFGEFTFSGFVKAMEDDLGTPEALAAAFTGLREANAMRQQLVADPCTSAAERERFQRSASLVVTLFEVLGFSVAPSTGTGAADRDDITDDEQIEALLKLRHDARRAGDYSRADSLRDRLAATGVQVTDTVGGYTWERTTASR